MTPAEVSTLNDYTELSQAAGRLVGQRLVANPHSVLGLPTGATPIGMYAVLVQLETEGLVTFQDVSVFDVDELCGLSVDDCRSFGSFMYGHLLSHVRLREENVHLLDGAAKDPTAVCAEYERQIAESGGLDLVVLGIGANGHIAFNEPGSPWESETRRVALERTTREGLTGSFGNPEQVPRDALTVGIGTIMRAKEVVLLASGRGKAQIILRAMDGPITKEVPASILRLHPRLRVLLDRDAGELVDCAQRSMRGGPAASAT